MQQGVGAAHRPLPAPHQLLQQLHLPACGCLRVAHPLPPAPKGLQVWRLLRLAQRLLRLPRRLSRLALQCLGLRCLRLCLRSQLQLRHLQQLQQSHPQFV